ncbi:hypothetical protein BaRGS_00040104, partial [Batillaria attramentaria]
MSSCELLAPLSPPDLLLPAATCDWMKEARGGRRLVVNVAAAYIAVSEAQCLKQESWKSHIQTSLNRGVACLQETKGNCAVLDDFTCFGFHLNGHPLIAQRRWRQVMKLQP